MLEQITQQLKGELGLRCFPFCSLSSIHLGKVPWISLVPTTKRTVCLCWPTTLICMIQMLKQN